MSGKNVPTAIGHVSVSTAHTLYLMMRVITYAETIRLIPSGEGGASVEAFKHAHTELIRLGVARHVEQVNSTATVAEFEGAAAAIVAALEESPVPEAEWIPLSEILGDELASLLGISLSSLARYRSGDRVTPDDVAVRLHVLAIVVSDLAGSYNDFGIRRWFRRPRTALGGRSPGEILSGKWSPDTEGVTKVQVLARSLLGATGG
jgi:hypothetical protein